MKIEVDINVSGLDVLAAAIGRAADALAGRQSEAALPAPAAAKPAAAKPAAAKPAAAKPAAAKPAAAKPAAEKPEKPAAEKPAKPVAAEKVFTADDIKAATIAFVKVRPENPKAVKASFAKFGGVKQASAMDENLWPAYMGMLEDMNSALALIMKNHGVQKPVDLDEGAVAAYVARTNEIIEAI